MDKGKDYDALAKADWESGLIFETVILFPLKSREPQSESIKRLYMDNALESSGDNLSNIEKQVIKKILVDATDDLINRVAIALKPSDIGQKWFVGYNSFLHRWSLPQRKILNHLIKYYGPHLKWLQNQIDKTNPPLERMVKMELQKSATALHDAIELARAHIRIINKLPTKWKQDGTEYSQITRNPYWNSIIQSVKALIDEAREDRNNYRLSDESPYRLLAELLHLAYPWAWKRDNATVKLLRERERV
jgi:hypothetical protein